ncbi:NUDIX domain-containing protein [bacterium]|nr:NUDIX domain-containing protein [bacterium]
MDLGSQLCRAKSPRCDHCPLRGECHFARHVSQEEREGEGRKKSAKRKSYGDGGGLPVIHVGIGCIHRDGNYLLGKRSEQKGGNWEFPGGKVEKGESVRAALKREIQEEVGVEVAVRPPFLVTSSSDAEFEWRLHFCRCQILDGTIQPLEHDELAWVPKSELASRGMPKTNDMAVQKLEKMK